MVDIDPSMVAEDVEEAVKGIFGHGWWVIRMCL